MIQETHFVSPMTKEALTKKRNSFIDKSGNKFSIVKGVPVLLPPEYMADWHRELIEVLLWEHPDEIAKIYKEKNWNSDPVGVYTAYISRILHDKEGIIRAFESYGKQDTAKWIIPIKSKPISNAQKRGFKQYSSKRIGKKRTETKLTEREFLHPMSISASKQVTAIRKSLLNWEWEQAVEQRPLHFK